MEKQMIPAHVSNPCARQVRCAREPLSGVTPMPSTKNPPPDRCAFICYGFVVSAVPVKSSIEREFSVWLDVKRPNRSLLEFLTQWARTDLFFPFAPGKKC